MSSSRKKHSHRPKVSWAQFSGPKRRVEPVGKPHDFKLVRAREPLHRFGDYTIHRAERARVKNAVVTVYEGKIVALGCLRVFWVEPEHRRKGLGAEMIAQLYLLDPDDWTHWVRRGGSTKTSMSTDMVRRGYELLIERGLL